jgi:tetratricopeptide (TPR) repeat protein
LMRAKSKISPNNVNLESLYAHSRNNGTKFIQGLILVYIGDVLKNLEGRLDEAEPWFQKAIEEDGGNGTRFQLARDYALYAEFIKRKGDRLKAQENLGRAIEIMKECGADGWVEKYEKELALI